MQDNAPVPVTVEISEHTLQHQAHNRDNGDVVLKYAAIDAHRIKFLVNDGADAINNAAHQDGETAYMIERQTGQPAIIGVVSKIERRANRVPPQHSIGDERTLRLTRCARRIHNCLRLVEINQRTQ